MTSPGFPHIRKNGHSCLRVAFIDCLEMAINFPEAIKNSIGVQHKADHNAFSETNRLAFGIAVWISILPSGQNIMPHGHDVQNI